MLDDGPVGRPVRRVERGDHHVPLGERHAEDPVPTRHMLGDEPHGLGVSLGNVRDPDAEMSGHPAGELLVRGIERLHHTRPCGAEGGEIGSHGEVDGEAGVSGDVLEPMRFRGRLHLREFSALTRWKFPQNMARTRPPSPCRSLLAPRPAPEPREAGRDGPSPRVGPTRNRPRHRDFPQVRMRCPTDTTFCGVHSPRRTARPMQAAEGRHRLPHPEGISAPTSRPISRRRAPDGHQAP